MTDENKPTDRFSEVFNRIFRPETDADRDLMWTAIIAFVAGALIF